MKRVWAILSGAYPPASGGVADYSRLVARGLAGAGDAVEVFTASGSGLPLQDAGVEVRVLNNGFDLGSFGEMDSWLSALPGSAEVLVQYTPYAFGWRGMNLPLCVWLRGQRGRRITIMFHEVMYPITPGQPIRHNLLSLLHREMARLLVRSASRLLVSTPAWEPMLREHAAAKGQIEWCPVPSNLPARVDPTEVAEVRMRIAPEGTVLIGHFGTYGRLIAEMLEPILVQLLACSGRRALLVGRGSDEFRQGLVARHPSLTGHIVAVGGVEPQSAAEHLAACDLLVQPFPDGVTTRRSSFMAGLALSVPLVTNLGALSEGLWHATPAAAVAPLPSAADIVGVAEALLADAPRGRSISLAARELYQSRFSLDRTLERLRAGQEGTRR